MIHLQFSMVAFASLVSEMIQKPFPLFRNQPTAGPPPPLVDFP